MKKHLNNKGISLTELLISLVVGMIVMSALTVLLSQGVKQYNKTTVMTQLQEDANIAVNNISDSIREANMIDISNSKTNATFQTHGGSENVIYQVKDRCLYLGSDTADSSKMGILCKNVEELKIEIVRSSLQTEAYSAEGAVKNKIVGINNPVQIKVTLTLELNGVTRTVTRVAAVRNKLTAANMKMQGFEFTSAPDIDFAREGWYIADD